jgi:phosphocarrier protein HPr
MATRRVTVRNELGLHARTATRLAECASRFGCEVWMSHQQKRVNGKSIMGILTLAAGPGMEVRLETRGQDERQALAALVELIESGFGEPEI